MPPNRPSVAPSVGVLTSDGTNNLTQASLAASVIPLCTSRATRDDDVNASDRNLDEFLVQIVDWDHGVALSPSMVVLDPYHSPWLVCMRHGCMTAATAIRTHLASKVDNSMNCSCGHIERRRHLQCPDDSEFLVTRHILVQCMWAICWVGSRPLASSYLL